jgi:ketol-acid reductoisomerase
MWQQGEIYHDDDLPQWHPQDEPVGIIGYGSQGAAQALNLRDGGIAVWVGLREGSPHRADACHQMLPVVTPAGVAATCRTVVLLVSDSSLCEVYGEIKSGLTAGKLLVLGGGYGYRFGGIEAPAGVDAVMVAPNGPGQKVREEFVAGRGVAAKVGVWADGTGRALERALGYARMIGAGRENAGVRIVLPGLEAELDLFSEQAVLAGGVPLLAARAARFLMAQGVPEELAVLECVREIKLIAEMLEKYGVKETYRRISLTAAYGGLTQGGTVLADDLENRLHKIWDAIRNGEFDRRFREWSRDPDARRKLLDDILGEGEI